MDCTAIKLMWGLLAPMATQAAAPMAAVPWALLPIVEGAVLDVGPAPQAPPQPQGPAWPKERAATAHIAQGGAKLRTPQGAILTTGSNRASATLDLATPRAQAQAGS